MTRLSPYEEERLAHSYHNYSAIGFLGLSCSLVLLLCTAYTHQQFSAPIATIDFGWAFEIAFNAGRVRAPLLEEVEYLRWDGDAEYNYIISKSYSDEELRNLATNRWILDVYKPLIADPENYRKEHHWAFPPWNTSTPFLKDRYSLKFGSTQDSQCNYDLGGRPDGIPSILRTLELSVLAQVIARALVLSTLYVRWYYTFIRCIAVQNTHTGCIIRCLACITPKVHFVAMTLEFLITCIQQSIDHSLKWFIPYVIIGWASLISLYMLLFTLISLIDGASESSSRLAQIRLVCFTICLMCSPVWIQGHLRFLARKTCFSEVPVGEALAEYFTAFAVMMFVATQLFEMRNYWGLLSCAKEDYRIKVNSSFEGRYRPAETEFLPHHCRRGSSTSSNSDVFMDEA